MAKKTNTEETEEETEAPEEKPKNTTKKEKSSEKETKETEKKEEVPVETRQVFKKIKVNFWRTRLHAEELGVYQSLKYRAKTRYFSPSFDIEGVVSIDGVEKYIIAFNKDQWRDSPVEDKRLICRLFTILEEKMGLGSGGTFQGGIEFSFTHSLIQGVEIKRTGAVFFVQLPTSKLLSHIVKSRRFLGTRWTLELLPEKTGDKLQVITAKGIVGPGRNYHMYLGDRKIARVDGQPARLNYEIEIYEETFAKDKTFVMIMTLFACACNFMHEIDKIMKKMSENVKATGTSEFVPHKQELDLFKNPRMVRK